MPLIKQQSRDRPDGSLLIRHIDVHLSSRKGHIKKLISEMQLFVHTMDHVMRSI